VPVRVESRSGSTQTQVTDLSYGGAFIPTDLPRPAGETVRLHLTFAGGFACLDTLATVRHARFPLAINGSGETPGMGVQFAGLAPSEFNVVRDILDSSSWSSKFRRPEAPAKRLFRRYSAPFRIEVANYCPEPFDTFDISVGGVRIDTDWAPLPGRVTPLRLHHPTNGSMCELLGEVVRGNRLVDNRPTLAFRFIHLKNSDIGGFESFLRSALPDPDRPLSEFVDTETLDFARTLEGDSF